MVEIELTGKETWYMCSVCDGISAPCITCIIGENEKPDVCLHELDVAQWEPCRITNKEEIW